MKYSRRNGASLGSEKTVLRGRMNGCHAGKTGHSQPRNGAGVASSSTSATKEDLRRAVTSARRRRGHVTDASLHARGSLLAPARTSGDRKARKGHTQTLSPGWGTHAHYYTGGACADTVPRVRLRRHCTPAALPLRRRVLSLPLSSCSGCLPLVSLPQISHPSFPPDARCPMHVCRFPYACARPHTACACTQDRLPSARLGDCGPRSIAIYGDIHGYQNCK